MKITFCILSFEKSQKLIPVFSNNMFVHTFFLKQVTFNVICFKNNIFVNAFISIIQTKPANFIVNWVSSFMRVTNMEILCN